MGFLDIPIEVREQILNDYLDGHTGEVPVNPTSSIDGREIKATGHIFYKKIQNPALPVLLVSKQLQAEMEGVLNRKRSQKANYALDIMYVKSCGLWPTWLSVPILTTNIDTLHATFRLFKQPDNVPKGMLYPNMWRGGDGGPPSGVWIFYRMFTGFLEQQIGPWPCRIEGDAEKITVQRLIIDVLTPVEPNILPLAPTTRRPGLDYMGRFSQRAENTPPSAAHIFANFIQREIGGLLCMGYYTTGYGNILHERFGSIEIQVNGTRHHMWDLSDLFSRLPLSDDQWGTFSARERKASYRQWKLDTAEKRQRAGFRVVEEDKTRRWWE